MRVDLTTAHKEEISEHIKKLCGTYFAGYASDYRDILTFIRLLSIKKSADNPAYKHKHFTPLIEVYRFPLQKIPFLEALIIPLELLQTIIREAIYSFLKLWLDNNFYELFCSDEEMSYYKKCHNILNPALPSKRKADIPKLDIRVKRSRDDTKSTCYNLLTKKGQRYIDKAFEAHDLNTILNIIDQLNAIDSEQAKEKCEQLKELFHQSLICDDKDTHYSRCEFYTRYYGSSLYAMQLPEHWNTYHRSENTRFFKKSGGRAGFSFKNPCMQDTTGSHAASSHLGNVKTPASTKIYSDQLIQNQTVQKRSSNLRDALLLYRLKMAQSVVRYFQQKNKNLQPIIIKDPKTGTPFEIMRPIIHTDHDYPCVVVHIPIVKSGEASTASNRFWNEHGKDFQTLLVCVFIAFVNTQANHKKIPIEMVLRSSFGHNLPSACQTGSSFRINTGIVPKAFTEVIADALIKTMESLEAINDSNSTLVIDEAFAEQVFGYNARKLKKAILKNKHGIYHHLMGSDHFSDIETPSNYQKVRKAFAAINKIKARKRQSKSIEVDLRNGMTTWKAIRQKGDSGGKLLLSECFRRAGAMDWFIDRMIHAIELKHPNAIDSALTQLIQQLDYSNNKVTMSELDFPEHKKFFEAPSISSFYDTDKEFLKIVEDLLNGLGERAIPTYGLFSEIERAGLAFMIHRRSQSTVPTEDGYGSDSEFEEDYQYDRTKYKLAHKKIRVANGMKAIIASHHGALKYLESLGEKHYTQDVTSMYFEVEPSLPMIKMSARLTKLPTNSQGHLSLLYCDLNRNNSDNAHDQDNLNSYLDRFKPIVIMLDITSASARVTLQSMKECFSKSSVKLVLLVESGLKHSQAGLDYNPYGEIRILSNNNRTTQEMYDFITDGLAEEDKLGPKAHELVRIFKSRGLARSLHGFFGQKTSAARHAPTNNKVTIKSPQ